MSRDVEVESLLLASSEHESSQLGSLSKMWCFRSDHGAATQCGVSFYYIFNQNSSHAGKRSNRRVERKLEITVSQLGTGAEAKLQFVLNH